METRLPHRKSLAVPSITSGSDFQGICDGLKRLKSLIYGIWEAEWPLGVQ
jgi:hypothetical protein